MFCKFSFSRIFRIFFLVKRKEDRISELPDDILQHILSFIDTTQAVQTSILSKRWRHLWRSIINIRLKLHGAVSRHGVPLFVSQFLSHRDAAAPLHDFHLSLDSKRWVSEDLSLVDKCVLYAINHGVQSLRLDVPRCLTLSLPDSLSTTTTLRELEIRKKNTWIDDLEWFSLPNLKILYLDVYLPVNFSGLPELEKLSLVLWDGLVLMSPKLRVLEILESESRNQIDEISAPFLTSFKYKGPFPFECSEMNLPMLEEVDIDINEIMFENRERMHLILVKLFRQLGNATSVSLSLNTLMFLELVGDSIEQTPPPFPNLKCLKVIKGSNKKVRTVLQSVLNYLTIGTLHFESSLKVEIPRDVAVVQQHPEAYYDL